MSNTKDANRQLIAGREGPPAGCDLETQLAYALRRVLDWPLPGGTVRNYACPPWLADIGDKALARFYEEHKEPERAH